MKCMKKIIGYISQPQVQKILLLMVILCIVTIGLYAQSDPGDDPGNAPVDGGLSLLLAGGIGFGIKQLRKKRN